MPVEVILFCLTIFCMIYCLFIGKLSIIYLIAITLIGLLPTLVIELTNGLQVGKSYLSSLIGLLMTVVLGYKYINIALGDFSTYLFTLVSIYQIIRFFKIYKNDLLPCRMGPANLRKYLINNNIKSFYTYDTAYNIHFVSTMIYGFESFFDLKFAKSIDDCPKDSIFIVPPTSSKSQFV